MDPSLSSQPQTAGQRPRSTRSRAPSRASTVASNTRSATSSNSSNNMHQPASPALSFVHPHRFHHNAAASSPRSCNRLAPQYSPHASAADIARPPTMSSFLQEKLQKERRAEIDKYSSSTPCRHNFDMSVSADLGRLSHDRCSRTFDSEPQRPQSSAGMDSPKKRGLGVKDMEQVISSLHKQNFDLKLELYHRRQRQTKLEAQLDALEAQDVQSQKLNQKLLTDLESRDKAIEEAVTMIVELEAKLDQLLDERAMLNHVDNHGFHASTKAFSHYQDSIANSSATDLSQLADPSKTPTVRGMPSFLSYHKPTTENLRNVYLHSRGSLYSLRQVSAGQSEAENVMSGLVSPTLSVLSESSFISIYGEKGADSSLVADFDEPVALSGFDGNSPVIIQDSPPPRSGLQIDQPDDSNSPLEQDYKKLLTQPRPLDEIFTTDNATQRRMDSGSRLRTNSLDVPSYRISRSEICRKRRDTSANPPVRHYAQDDARAAMMRRVATDAPGGVRLDQALPPTPDTISSSTLHRFKNSNDNLSVRRQASDERQRPGPFDAQAARDQNGGTEANEGVSLLRKQVSRDAPDARRDNGPLPRHDAYGAKNMLRPHSVGDATISHGRRCSWESDDSDAKSLESSLDIWMRESTKPLKESGRTSPDLFGFSNSVARGGLASTLMYGGDKHSSLGAMPSTDYMHDLLSLRKAILTPKQPPPPERRSSLYDPVRSASAVPTGTSPLAGAGTWQPSLPLPPWHAELSHLMYGRDGDGTTDLRRDTHTHTPVPDEQKKGANHHPPNAWQQGPRAGLKGLFRRSLTGSSLPPASPPTKVESGAGKQETEATLPSWVSRSSAAVVVDLDRSGSTPPPITLKPRQGRRKSGVTSSVDDGVALDLQPMASPQVVQSDAVSQHGVAHLRSRSQSAGGAQLSGSAAPSGGASTTGTRRKWLPGFSRNKA